MKVKAKRMEINPDALFMIMENDTAWRVSKGVPKGARLRGFTIDPYTQVLHLFVEHDSFPEVDMNTVIPKMETFFKKIQ